MALGDIAKSGNENEQSDTDVTQSKSLIGNTFSTEHDDKYMDVSDWDWFDPLAYQVTKDGGIVRAAAKSLSPSGSHHEWYCRLQVGLAHIVGDALGYEELPDGSEPRGAVPLMDFIGFDAGDIAEYLMDEETDVTVSDLRDAMHKLNGDEDSNEEQEPSESVRPQNDSEEEQNE